MARAVRPARTRTLISRSGGAGQRFTVLGRVIELRLVGSSLCLGRKPQVLELEVQPFNQHGVIRGLSRTHILDGDVSTSNPF